jgi:hypothetical protein
MFSEILNLVRILKAAWKLFFSPWRDHMPQYEIPAPGPSKAQLLGSGHRPVFSRR